YLDLELSGWPNIPPALSYIDGWMAAVKSRNYRTGLYLSVLDLNALGVRYPDAAMWFYKVPIKADSVFDEATQRLVPRPLSSWPNVLLTDGTSRPATAWQFDQYHDEGRLGPDGQPSPPARRRLDGTKLIGVKIDLGAGASHFYSPIDFDASLVLDPAHP